METFRVKVKKLSEFPINHSRLLIESLKANVQPFLIPLYRFKFSSGIFFSSLKELPLVFLIVGYEHSQLLFSEGCSIKPGPQEDLSTLT